MHIVMLQALMLLLAVINVACVFKRGCSTGARIIESGMSVAMIAHVLPQLVPVPMIALAGGLVLAVPLVTVVGTRRLTPVDVVRSLAALDMAAMLLVHSGHAQTASAHHGIAFTNVGNLAWFGFAGATVAVLTLLVRGKHREHCFELITMWSGLGVMAAMSAVGP